MELTSFYYLVLASASFVVAGPARDQIDGLGGPLILTPYIEAGKIEEGRKASVVTGIKPHVDSYAGFFNVDKKCDSNLFFWYFPSQSNPKEDPVSVWLNGGPGASSMATLLLEHGPYELMPNNELKLRDYSWNRNSSIIYFDNPVGTGYSFTTGTFEECYAKNQTQISQNFLQALEQFFKLFPELLNNQFFLTGVSYAGKYIPGIAHTILTSNTTVKLTGIAIGNGWMDPYSQVKNHETLYNLGFVDEKTKIEMANIEKKVQQLIMEDRYLDALDMKKKWTDLFYLKTGYRSVYNYLHCLGDKWHNPYPFLNRTDIRKALHVGNAALHDGTLTHKALLPDIMRSIKPWLETLMNHYKVLLYFGQMDLLVTPATSMEFIKSLKWKGAGDLAKADRKLYKVGTDVAGYVKTSGNFTEVLIRNAGHTTPLNKPRWTLDMYNKFIFNIPFAK